jgi:hypothetical protein
MENQLRVIEGQQSMQQPTMITPAGTIEDILAQWDMYQELKKQIGKPNDFQQIGDKQHPKKSFVRKVQRFFNVSCEIIQDEPLRDENGRIIAWLAKARAIHTATGAFQEADGSCSMDEKVDKYGNIDPKRATIHNIRAHAVTRAKNRAILDLVGFGEVSAEEIDSNEYEIHNQPTPTSHQSPQRSNKSTKPASQKQIQKLTIEAEKRGLTEKWIKAWINYFYKKESRKELTSSEASKMIDKLIKLGNEELNEILNKIKAHYQAGTTQEEKTVYNVNPETGEIINPDGPITDEELDEILSRANRGEF